VIYIIFFGHREPMLRFQLHQVHVLSLDKYFLPLPKLSDLQVAALTAHLEGRGFSVRTGAGPTKRVALKGSQRISIDGGLGLAGSGADVLDAIAPAIPAILELRGAGGGATGQGVAERYFSLKRYGASAVLQFFPRLESLRAWTCLRRDGLCGLTPDEAAVLKRLFGKASGASRVRCVTAKPRLGSRRIQIGRNLYYESAVPVAEFLSSLRTIDSVRADSASYLPRDSIFTLRRMRVDTRLTADELGEWCCS
jgi:hypothetical protein